MRFGENLPKEQGSIDLMKRQQMSYESDTLQTAVSIDSAHSDQLDMYDCPTSWLFDGLKALGEDEKTRRREQKMWDTQTYQETQTNDR